MSKTLAELRQSPRVGLPTRTYSLCLAPQLMGEVQELFEAWQAAKVAEQAQREGDESAAPPKRMGGKAESAKIREQIVALSAEAEEHTGILTLRGFDEGAWRLWVDEHPAREGNKRDDEIAHGFCNADALIDGLEQFAHQWNGADMAAGDWAFIAENAAPADIKQIAELVVAMHENAVNLPKLLSSSLATLDAVSD
jgi:hypothetical protein